MILFLQQLYGASTPKRLEIALTGIKIDYVQLVKTSLNPEGHQNYITGSKVIAILLDGGDFVYWWSCIGKGLRLQPAQQACFFSWPIKKKKIKNICNLILKFYCP